MMKTLLRPSRLLPAYLVVVLCLINAPLLAAQQDEQPICCGVACVDNLHRLYTGRLSDGLHPKLAPKAHVKSMSMAEVRDLAKTVGLDLVGVKCTVDEIGRLSTPAIAAMKQEHFLVVDRISGSLVRVFDGEFSPAIMPLSDLEKSFSGTALVPSEALKTPGGPPALFSDDPIADVGVKPANSSITRTFTIHNSAASPVQVREIRPCCGAVANMPNGSSIPPDGSQQLVFSTNVGSGNPVMEKTVLIITDRSSWPILYLSVLGQVVEDAVPVPQIVDFGSVKRGKRLERKIELQHVAQAQAESVAISSSAEYVQAEKTSYDPASGTLVMTVRLDSSNLRGRVKERVNVKLDPATSASTEIQIPVTAEVLGHIHASPSEICLGLLQAGTSASCKVQLTCKSEFKVLDVKCPRGVAATYKAIDHGYMLDVSVSGSAEFDTVNSHVTVVTGDSEDTNVDIPIYAAREHAHGS